MKHLAYSLLFVSSHLAAHDEGHLFAKEEEAYRVYEDAGVQAFYYKNHVNQTLDFVLGKKAEYLGLAKMRMGVWEAMEMLDEVLDESDPDLHINQTYHAFQTAEAMRKEGQPEWMILTGLIHDLGKVLHVFGEPQWAVVGDTFPVGAPFSSSILFPEYFSENPDNHNPAYNQGLGIYAKGCGLDALQMSWGHDEYLYQVVKDYLPEEAAYIIRFHSFYAYHREGAYMEFQNEKDKRLWPYLQAFNKYDLYSKDEEGIDVEALRPYYRDLVQRYFPQEIDW